MSYATMGSIMRLLDTQQLEKAASSSSSLVTRGHYQPTQYSPYARKAIFPFLKLPAEVQLDIMELALAEDGPVTIKAFEDGVGEAVEAWKPPALVSVSRELRYAAWKIYFKFNREFIIHNDGSSGTLKFLTRLEHGTYRLMARYVQRITLVFKCYMGESVLQDIEAACFKSTMRDYTIIKRKPEIFSLLPIVIFRDLPAITMPADKAEHFSHLFHKKLRGIPHLSSRGHEVPLDRWIIVWLYRENPNFRPLRTFALQAKRIMKVEGQAPPIMADEVRKALRLVKLMDQMRRENYKREKEGQERMQIDHFDLQGTEQRLRESEEEREERLLREEEEREESLRKQEEEMKRVRSQEKQKRKREKREKQRDAKALQKEQEEKQWKETVLRKKEEEKDLKRNEKNPHKEVVQGSLKRRRFNF